MHFFFKLQMCKKTNKLLDKTLPWPMKLGQNFVKYFVHFLGNGDLRKMPLRFTDLYLLADFIPAF